MEDDSLGLCVSVCKSERRGREGSTVKLLLYLEQRKKKKKKMGCVQKNKGNGQEGKKRFQL